MSGIDISHAGVASGVIVTAFQIGASLGVATIGSVFYGVLGSTPDAGTYARALAVTLICNVVLFVLDVVLCEMAIRSWKN